MHKLTDTNVRSTFIRNNFHDNNVHSTFDRNNFPEEVDDQYFKNTIFINQ